MSTGLNIDVNKVDMSNHNFEYIQETLKDATVINFSVPVSLHLLPFRYVGLFLEWTSTEFSYRIAMRLLQQ